MTTIGIDPGFAKGGVAILSADTARVHDLPTISGRGVDVHALAAILASAGAQHAYIENVASMPKQGVSTTFKFGYGVGQIHAAVALACIPLTLVTPGAWKGHHKLTKAKGESTNAFKERARHRALQLFPGLASDLARKKDADRAEALLIAAYGLGIGAVTEAREGAE